MYFYNQDAQDDDKGLSSVIKDAGTFFITDGKNSLVVSYDPCLQWTSLLLSQGVDSNCRVRNIYIF